MKINKILVLALLLVSLLAIAVASQIFEAAPERPASFADSKIAQITDKIIVEENQDCTITYYNATENIYGNVTRERDVFGKCQFFQNFTSCLNISGPNTGCSLQQIIRNITCKTGTEYYNSYEVTGTRSVLINTTKCQTKSFVVSILKGQVTEVKEVDFLNWGVCVQTIEDNCVVITCGSLNGGGANNGIFNGCDGGKSCQKFLFCEDKTKVYYKASREDFVAYDPTFKLSKLAYKEVRR